MHHVNKHMFEKKLTFLGAAVCSQYIIVDFVTNRHTHGQMHVNTACWIILFQLRWNGVKSNRNAQYTAESACPFVNYFPPFVWRPPHDEALPPALVRPLYVACSMYSRRDKPCIFHHASTDLNLLSFLLHIVTMVHGGRTNNYNNNGNDTEHHDYGLVFIYIVLNNSTCYSPVIVHKHL